MTTIICTTFTAIAFWAIGSLYGDMKAYARIRHSARPIPGQHFYVQALGVVVITEIYKPAYENHSTVTYRLPSGDTQSSRLEDFLDNAERWDPKTLQDLAQDAPKETP